MGGLGLNLLIALAALLPGLTSVVQLYLPNGSKSLISRRLPSANSLVIIWMVPFFALLIHSLAAGLFALSAALPPLIHFPFEPNPYLLLRRVGGVPHDGAALTYALLCGTLISFMPVPLFWLAARVARRFSEDLPEDGQGEEEDWLDYLDRAAESENRALFAWVLTKTGTAQETIGYLGGVQKVALEDGVITGITLHDAYPYTIELTRTGLTRIEHSEAEASSFVHFAQNQIHHVSFDIAEFIDEDDDAADSDIED